MMQSEYPMQTNQDPRESGYGGYQGNAGYQQQQYSTPPQGQGVPPAGNMYDDAFIDAFSQRVAQRMSQGSQGKLHFPTMKGNRATAGQKLALAIVSIALLVPFSGIMIGLVAVSHFWWVGLAGLGIICFTLFLINAVFDSEA